jgi:hypothetical protein
VAVGIRLATGSATVATITAAGIVAPLAADLDRSGVALLVLAIGAGFVSYAVIKVVQGRAREVHPLLWVVAALFVIYFAIAPIETALGI